MANELLRGNAGLPQAATSLDDQQWDQLRQLAESETGMELSGTRFPRLQEAVTKVVARHQSDIPLQRILADTRHHSVFLERVCAELTIGESFFLRNEHHFQALREHVVPDILKQNAASQEIRIWSAGCATGEEPYSLAILLDQMLQTDSSQVANWSILGTDLNPAFLERAREALYTQWSFRGTDINHDRNYFLPEGNKFRLHPRLRSSVHFSYLNLVKDVYPSPMTGTMALDLILFRNVAIYLKKEVTQAIIGRFHRALRPGGWLLLGETELNIASADGFEVKRFEQATLYQKTSERNERAKLAVAFPAPVLVDVSPPTQIADTPVATLPDWVPLPAARPETLSRPAPASWERIESFVQNRNFAEAERLIESVPSLQERGVLRLRYARSLLAGAEVERAHTMLDSCIVDDPLSVEPQLLKGSFAEEAGDLETAEQAYRRALFVDRFCPMAHFHLGLLQQKKGDLKAATRSFQLVQQMASKHEPHAVVEYGEGVCYGRLLEMTERILDF